MSGLRTLNNKSSFQGGKFGTQPKNWNNVYNINGMQDKIVDSYGYPKNTLKNSSVSNSRYNAQKMMSSNQIYTSSHNRKQFDTTKNVRTMKNSRNSPSSRASGFRIIQDENSVPEDENTTRVRLNTLIDRYFSDAVDFNNNKDKDGKLKPNINTANKFTPNRNSKSIYKLTVPLASKQQSYHSVDNIIESTYKNEFAEKQPYSLLTGEGNEYKTLKELISAFAELVQQPSEKLRRNTGSPNKYSNTVSNKLLNTVYHGNDSFDLSFDGKALDRSDILRMVDSFSVAFSDDENVMDEGDVDNSEYIASLSNKFLPAEITSTNL